MKKEFDWILKEKYRGKLDKRIKADMRRIIKGEPVDYVIGFSNFLGCKIDLSYRPLIPRVETEFWVEQAIKRISINQRQDQHKSALKVLDLFAGSGCIGIAILRACPELVERVDFGESSKKFLKQIKRNLKLNKINPKMTKLIQTDVFKNIKDRYDYIFASPPYVAKTGKFKIQPEVLKYEPHKSLFGGKDGLFYIRKLIEEGKNYLKKNGKMYIEFSPEQKNKIKKLVELNGWEKHQFFKDQYKRWRWLVISN